MSCKSRILNGDHALGGMKLAIAPLAARLHPNLTTARAISPP